jgi:hypothetical protein
MCPLQFIFIASVLVSKCSVLGEPILAWSMKSLMLLICRLVPVLYVLRNGLLLHLVSTEEIPIQLDTWYFMALDNVATADMVLVFLCTDLYIQLEHEVGLLMFVFHIPIIRQILWPHIAGDVLNRTIICLFRSFILLKIWLIAENSYIYIPVYII